MSLTTAQLLRKTTPRKRVSKPAPLSAAPLIPPNPTLSQLSDLAKGCKACPLWKRGTQTVFGEGSKRAKVIFIGEQPGFDEDLAGKPFVGPAGKTLDKGLVAAGINR